MAHGQDRPFREPKRNVGTNWRNVAPEKRKFAVVSSDDAKWGCPHCNGKKSFMRVISERCALLECEEKGCLWTWVVMRVSDGQGPDVGFAPPWAKWGVCYEEVVPHPFRGTGLARWPSRL